MQQRWLALALTLATTLAWSGLARAQVDLSVLDDDINTSVEEELHAVFEDLGEDQLAEVIAFCWVGQGTYESSDWDEAMEEAHALVGEGTSGAIDELMDQPMLASVLEAGLAAFDLNCDGMGEVS